MTDADQPTTEPSGRTCCLTHNDACRFGRDHSWAGPFLLGDGKSVNGEKWSHPDDVRCDTCAGVCTGNRPTPRPEPDRHEPEGVTTMPKAVKERTAYWGTCVKCEATVVVYPHPGRSEDLPPVAEWERGFPSDCPVCDEPLDWDGSDPVEDVRL